MLSAKLQVPAINKNIISRERVLQKLQKALECKLTLITAPAGYGKTTAILHWLEKCGLPVAWLSLDSHDNSPGVFWPYFCSALDNIVAGISQGTKYVFSDLEMMKANLHINILIDKLAEVESDFILVLDDLHYIADPAIMEGLSYLIDYLPPKMHLIFISRSTPEIGLARHKFKWQIQHIKEKDLRFGENEIFLFYQARGIILKNSEIRTLKSYTGGWAAALVAVAMSVEDDGGHCDVIADLKVSLKDIGQYLNDEVLRIWSDEKRNFAMKTCLLDTLSAGICDAITGENNGQRLLEEIYEANGFMVALDGPRREFRYHHLFKSFLQERLWKTSPDEIPRLHKRAGLWFREQGMIPEAIEHLLEGNSYPEAIDLIEHRIDPLIQKNDFGRVLSWIERLPPGYKDNSYKIAVIYAMYYAEIGRLDLSRHWLDRMKALREAHQITDPEQNRYRLTEATLVEANLLLREGNMGFLALIFSAGSTDGGRYFKMPEYHDPNQADIYFYRCPVNKLITLCRDAPGQYARITESYRKLISKNPGYAPLILGEYYYESNRSEEALPYLLKALDEAQSAGCPGAFVPVMVNLARIRRGKGDMQGAFETLAECERKLPSMGKSHWKYTLQAFRCRLYLDMGETAGVDQWFASRKLDIYSELSKAREFEFIVYARALIFKGRPQDARLLLERLLTFTEETARLHSRVEILNLLALLEYMNNDIPKCTVYLESALSIGMKEGYVRSFLDEFAPMAQLLSYYTTRQSKRTKHPDAELLIAFAKKLLGQMQENFLAVPETYEQTAAGRIEKLLTAREKMVLELLLKANTNQEISIKLGISLRTVKTHTGNIYSKMGVKTRAQCMKLIRESF